MAEEEKELSKEQKQRRLHDNIDAEAERLGLGERRTRTGNNNPEGFGLCSTCSNMFFVKTEYHVRVAVCEKWSNEHTIGLPLHDSDPVTECSGYRKIGEMSLWDMSMMATLISPPPRKIGFGRKENDK